MINKQKGTKVVYNKCNNKQPLGGYVMKRSDLQRLTNKALNDILGNKYTETQLKKIKKERLVDEIMKSGSRPGVIGTLIVTLFSGFASKEQLLKTLKKRFPERAEEKMSATVNAQLYRLRSKYNVVKNESGEYGIV